MPKRRTWKLLCLGAGYREGKAEKRAKIHCRHLGYLRAVDTARGIQNLNSGRMPRRKVSRGGAKHLTSHRTLSYPATIATKFGYYENDYGLKKGE